jgi:hypothetical protein
LSSLTPNGINVEAAKKRGKRGKTPKPAELPVPT